MSAEPTNPVTVDYISAEPTTKLTDAAATSHPTESTMPSPWSAFPSGQTDMGEGEGRGPWTYHILPEDLLKAELDRHAFAKKVGVTHSVSMQPCAAPGEASQDRYAVHEWELEGGNWRFNAIFDGIFRASC